MYFIPTLRTSLTLQNKRFLGGGLNSVRVFSLRLICSCSALTAYRTADRAPCRHVGLPECY